MSEMAQDRDSNSYALYRMVLFPVTLNDSTVPNQCIFHILYHVLYHRMGVDR